MTLRTMTAGLLVGLVGFAGLAAALAVEHHTVKQVHPFLIAHPEMFPVTPNTGLLGVLAATLVLGLAFAWLYDRAFPRPPHWSDALAFGCVFWLGLMAPAAALTLLWTPLLPAAVLTAAAAWLLELALGSLLLTRLLKPESRP